MNITSKYRSLSVQAKAALWFTICSFLQKGISLITVPIFTRLMSTEEYGTYTVYLSWLQILTIMTSLYLFNGVYDNAMAKYEKQRDEYTSAMQGLTLVITGAVFALYCFTSGFWEKILNLPKSMILLMFLEAPSSPTTVGDGRNGLRMFLHPTAPEPGPPPPCGVAKVLCRFR